MLGVFMVTTMQAANEFKVSALDFTANGKIPKEFTGEGDDLMPRLVWSNMPKGTKSFALIVDDPDAPGKVWVHWLVYNIPGDKRSTDYIKKGVEQMPDGTMQGMNSWPHIGYNGPMPPPGHGVHHYHFKVYALDAKLDLKPRATKEQLLKAMGGHILGQAEIIGTYERK